MSWIKLNDTNKVHLNTSLVIEVTKPALNSRHGAYFTLHSNHYAGGFKHIWYETLREAEKDFRKMMTACNMES